MLASVLVITQLVSSPANRIPYADPERVAEGKRIYVDHCASCHGENLEGEPNWQKRDSQGLLPAPPHDETGHTWHHADELLFKLTHSGIQAVAGPDYKSRMPAFQGQLNDQQIWSALAFIKSSWPEEIIVSHNRLNEK